jgi:Tol biopolymer transport system component
LDGTITKLADIHLTNWAAISPDASRIAFISDEQGYQDLYVMNVDGTDKKRVAINPGYSCPNQ